MNHLCSLPSCDKTHRSHNLFQIFLRRHNPLIQRIRQWQDFCFQTVFSITVFHAHEDAAHEYGTAVPFAAHHQNQGDRAGGICRCDYLTMHIHSTPETFHYLNAETFAKMKPGMRILNFARGELVDDDALLAAIESGQVARYVTDFPNAKLVGKKNVVCFPHLGATTPEAEEKCAVMAAREIVDYLRNGNIRNSVNYPSCDMGVCTQAGRISVFHKNVANMITRFAAVFGEKGINISDMINKSKGEVAYTMFDVEEQASEEIINMLRAIPGVFRVRVVK